jgi:PAS domain S-box-containing protein
LPGSSGSGVNRGVLPLAMSRLKKADEIQQLRRAVGECDARRRALLDSALDSIICTDEQARITDFNAAAERAFRAARSTVLGKDLADVIFPEALRERHRRELFSPVHSGIDVVGNRLETRGQCSDGSEFPAEITVTRTFIQSKRSFTVYVRDLTARKRAEQAVVWLAAVVESSQDAIIGKDLEGKIISWNKGAELMFGYTTQEAVGRHISFLSPLECETPPEVVEELRAGRQIANLETIRMGKGGNLLNVSLTISPVCDSSGAVIGGSVIARDVTASKLLQKALRKANETSVYASPVPIIAADAESLVTLWNPAAERLFGWRESEVLGKPNPIIPAEGVEQATRLHQRLLSGETINNLEVRRVKRDGTVVNVSLSGTPLWGPNRTVRGIIGFLTDITDRKFAEEALRQAEEKYRSIFENSAEGIYQTTPLGEYISANPALARMLGFDSPEELVAARQDMGRQQYVDPELHAEFMRLMQQEGEVNNFDHQARRKDGKVIWVSENAHAIKDEAGQILYFEGTVQDITQQRGMEQQLRQMQKIEAIGRLAGGVAHDFNNILMAISSYAELLARKMEAQDPNRRYVDEIDKAMNRGASLTQGLLAFSRKQLLSPRVVDLNTLIVQQTDMLKRLIGENLELKFSPGTGLGKVKVDPGQLEQVVMNLVINSRDAMPNGGEILIKTSRSGCEEAGKRPIAVVGDCVMLSVTDNGSGMDSETVSHLFEPFFTTKGQGKGTGLGLATVFGIVKQSAGYIDVQSKPGRGTTFRIYFPETQDALQEAGDVLPPSLSGSETVLIVEDEDAVRESIAEYLAENGYRVLVAGRGSEALGIAAQYSQPIHLMLTDLVMPHMSGKELARQIVSLHPEIKAVFMSGYSNNLLSDSQQMLDRKYDLLQKPFRLTELGSFIRRALDRSRAVAAG